MKKFGVIILLTFCLLANVLASKSFFHIDSSKMKLTKNSNENKITDEFNKNYSLSYSIASDNDKVKDEIDNLSRKTTYLLLGESDTLNESAEEYYKRRTEYMNLRYDPEVPKDPNSPLGLDMNSQEYMDDLVSGISVPSMFNLLDELNISYSGIDSIRVSINDDMIISYVTLLNVKMREEDENNPMEYKYISTNVVLYYFFKQLNGQYKLYYIFGETDDSLNEYYKNNNEIENYKSMAIAPDYDSNLKKIYDFSKADNLSEDNLKEIYNNNYKSIVMLDSYYDLNRVNSAHGIFIGDGLIVTTWSFFEKALKNAQFIGISDNDGNIYNLDGIVTINPDTDLVVLKVKERFSGNIILGSTSNLHVEDPVITISSNTGLGYTVKKGIVTSTDSYLQHSIPLQISDQGSPLFNSQGEVIGLNTAKSINSDIAMAIKVDALKEIKDKFSNINYDSIETVSFDELKEKYYYSKINDETITNNIPKKQWNDFKKVGNIEKNIHLQLLKASYDDGVVSLRYDNSVSKFLGNMQPVGSFITQLKKDDYKEILNSETKKIYQNSQYKVIIMNEFDYLIIVMVRL